MPAPTPYPHHHPPAPPPSCPATYVPLPRRLLDDLRDTPVAVGVYMLIGRLYQISGEPVPLSPGDLRDYDPALSHGAARRALERLAASGYAVVTTGGRKLAYLPTWGHVHSTPLPWSRASAGFGRPRHIVAVRLDDRLLDLCLGRLRPHKTHRAVVERYLTSPLLGLRELGAYALALAGLPCANAALHGLGLLSPDGSARPLPDDRTVLAIATQRAATSGDGNALTIAGRHHAGLPAATAAVDAGAPLFFVPPGEIGEGVGGGIGDRIGPDRRSSRLNSAAERQAVLPQFEAAGSHGITDKDRENGIPTTPRLPAPHVLAGGGEASVNEPRSAVGSGPLAQAAQGGDSRERGSTRTPSPLTSWQCRAPAIIDADVAKTTRLLRALGVRGDIACQLADRPAAQVARVIAQARARQGVRDVAAWVVSALRALPADEPPLEELRPLSARPIHTHPRLSDEQRDRWIRRFRAAPTPHEQRTVLAQLEQEHPR